MDRVEARITEIAGRQDNIIRRDQLRQAGLTDREIAGRVARGEVRRVHQAVYLTGHAPPTLRGRARAAIFACGSGAVVSHRTAAGLWGLLPPRNSEVIDVTIAGRSRGPLDGVRVHRVSELRASEVRIRDGLRISSPARVICELAAMSTRAEVEHALQEAMVKRLLTEPQLHEAVHRWGSRRGARLLRSILGAESGPGFTRSEAERMLLRIVAHIGLPQPEKNVRIEGHLVDAVWRQQRLIVEIDGQRTHLTRAAFERDRARDADLTAKGWRVIRFTYAQLRHRSMFVGARLAVALAQAA